MEAERPVACGSCPHCESLNYVMVIENYKQNQDSLNASCICKNCNKDFTQTFKLSMQEWNTENKN